MQTQEREGGDVSLLAIQPLIAVHSASREATFKFQPTIGAHCVAEHNSATKERERDVSLTSGFNQQHPVQCREAS